MFSMQGFLLDLRWKILFMVGFIVSLSVCFIYPLHFFNSTDPVPEFIIIDAAKQKEFGEFTVKVTTGMFIKNFSTFDVTNNRFVMDALVWFEFNSDEIMLETIGKFSFDKGRFLIKSNPDIKIVGDKTIAIYDVRVEFKADLEYKKFPLEDHKVSLVLSNNFVTPYEMFFLVDNTLFNVKQDMFIANWKLRDLNTDSGYDEPKLDTRKNDKQTSFPKAVFTMNFEKSGTRQISIIFLPLLFATILALLSFFFAILNTIGRIALATASLSAMIGYRFVIEKMLPDVGYFTLADSMYLLLLSVTFVTFILQIFLARICNTEVTALAEGVKDEVLSGKPLQNLIFMLEASNTVLYYLLIIITAAITGYLTLL